MTSETAERGAPPTSHGRTAEDSDLGAAGERSAVAGAVGVGVVLAAPLVAALVHLTASDAATFASWVVLVVGLVAWSPVSRRWPRVRRLGPGVALAYLAVGASFLLAPG
jgi:hypothetical protein